ncbi:unnamed protein product, partial [Thlaspi arvense]
MNVSPLYQGYISKFIGLANDLGIERPRAKEAQAKQTPGSIETGERIIDLPAVTESVDRRSRWPSENREWDWGSPPGFLEWSSSFTQLTLPSNRSLLKITEEEFSGPPMNVVVELILGLTFCMWAALSVPGKFHSILPYSDENRYSDCNQQFPPKPTATRKHPKFNKGNQGRVGLTSVYCVVESQVLVH